MAQVTPTTDIPLKYAHGLMAPYDPRGLYGAEIFDGHLGAYATRIPSFSRHLAEHANGYNRGY